MRNEIEDLLRDPDKGISNNFLERLLKYVKEIEELNMELLKKVDKQ